MQNETDFDIPKQEFMVFVFYFGAHTSERPFGIYVYRMVFIKFLWHFWYLLVKANGSNVHTHTSTESGC